MTPQKSSGDDRGARTSDDVAVSLARCLIVIYLDHHHRHCQERDKYKRQCIFGPGHTRIEVPEAWSHEKYQSSTDDDERRIAMGGSVFFR